MLELDRVSAYYHDPTNLTLQDVSLGVPCGEVVAVLGTNGAGKSTVLRTVFRRTTIASGAVRFEGICLNNVPPHCICRYGIAYVPEGQRVWPNMTVDENLRMGAYTRDDSRAVAEDLDRTYATFPALRALARRTAHGLSGGERQMVAIGRALMLRPRCLLLDEPTLGLAPGAADDILAVVAGATRDRRMAVVLVEQNGVKALTIADRVVVMRLGRVALESPTTSVTWEHDIAPVLLGN